MSELASIVLLIVIGIMAGITNAAAGLASLVSYPSLLAMGLSPVMANVTICFSTVASGYSSVVTSARELRNNRQQGWIMLPVVLAGAFIGALLLFILPSKWFQELVPICIGMTGIVLIVSHKPRQASPVLVQNSRAFGRSRLSRIMAWGGIFIVGIYAGYFNAGAGVMMLTLLTVVNRQQSFAVNNALKNVAMTATNTMAIIIFAIETVIYWHHVLPLFIGNIIGGILGPIIVRRLPGRLMQVVVGSGALILSVSLVIRNMM